MIRKKKLTISSCLKSSSTFEKNVRGKAKLPTSDENFLPNIYIYFRVDNDLAEGKFFFWSRSTYYILAYNTHKNMTVVIDGDHRSDWEISCIFFSARYYSRWRNPHWKTFYIDDIHIKSFLRIIKMIYKI